MEGVGVVGRLEDLRGLAVAAQLGAQLVRSLGRGAGGRWAHGSPWAWMQRSDEAVGVGG